MSKGELSILIVDDDVEDILLTENLLREGLKGIALDLHKATSFDTGLRQAETAHHDVCLVDYRLGEKTGLELIQGLRARGVDTPVVVLTCQGDEEVAVQAMKLGAADYLPKFNLSEDLIRAAIRGAIESHEKEMVRLQIEEQLRKMNQKLESWVEELEHQSRDIALLDELGNTLHTCVSSEEAYALITQRVPPFFAGRSGALYMFEGSRGLVEAVVAWGDHPPSHLEFAANECWGLRRGRSYVVWDSRTEIACPHLRGSSWKGHLCVPMMAYGETLGVMVLEAAAPPAPAEEGQTGVAEASRRFAESLTEHLALALANLRLCEALRMQSVRDALTGLFNRRYMEESLERVVSAAGRRHQPLAVLMLDLDHFKEYNDTHGHAAGDAILRELGRLLLSHTRGEDVSCRYGGEEFVLVLPDVVLNVAAMRADQLRSEFKRLVQQHNHAGEASLTLSIGIAIAPEHGLSSKALLEAADAALYLAKKGGRDRVVIAEASGPLGELPAPALVAKVRAWGGKP
jgi:diguanylate cyclase (GGDEF)-like protein